MDWNMPGMSGLEALAQLRKSPETNEIPVIILSGAPSDTVYPAVERLPRVAFLKKPVDLDSLSEMVRHLLERYPRAA